MKGGARERGRARKEEKDRYIGISERYISKDSIEEGP